MAQCCDIWPAHGPSQALLAAVRVSGSPSATLIARVADLTRAFRSETASRKSWEAEPDHPRGQGRVEPHVCDGCARWKEPTAVASNWRHRSGADTAGQSTRP